MASAVSDDYKQQIADRLGGVRQLPYGPLRMQVCFTVGPARNWLNLWKPTIDDLVPLLGRDPRSAATAGHIVGGRAVRRHGH